MAHLDDPLLSASIPYLFPHGNDEKTLTFWYLCVPLFLSYRYSAEKGKYGVHRLQLQGFSALLKRFHDYYFG
jgi:hypothetical protein